MKQTRNVLKGRFERVDNPTPKDFDDLFNSTYKKTDNTVFDMLPTDTVIESDVEIINNNILHLNEQLLLTNEYPLLYTKYGIAYGGDGIIANPQV